MNTILPSKARRSVSRRAVVGAVTAGAVITAGGVGYAAWSVTATGSSQAKSGTPTAGVVAVATPATSLYPGGSTPVYFTVTNPNSFPVTYNAATLGTVTVDDATACPVSNVTVVANPAVSITLAAGATSTVQSPADAITMVTGAPDGCQGRTFTIATSLSGVSG